MADLRTTYKQLTDDELMRLASEKGELVEEAQIALENEMRNRGLNCRDLAAFHSEIERAEAERAIRDIGALHPYGIGKRFFGCADRAINNVSGAEEYNTTLWAVILWFPLFPLASMRIRRTREREWQLFRREAFEIVEPTSRNWAQIFQTWAVALGIALVLSFGIRSLLEFVRR